MSVSATGGSKATTSSSPKSNAGASASASANAGGAAKAKAGAQTGGAQTGGDATGSSAVAQPSDSVKIDRAEAGDSSGVSSNLMSGLSEAYGAEELLPRPGPRPPPKSVKPKKPPTRTKGSPTTR